NTNDFQKLRTLGKRFSFGPLRFSFARTQNGYSRLGLILARKQIPKANQRNYYKRVIRESFRLYQEKLINLDIAVLVTRDALKMNKQAFRKCIEEAWKRLSTI
ncbi:MAG: ribonuclease P protein component, partial [Gammaproteobacteria bacterium]